MPIKLDQYAITLTADTTANRPSAAAGLLRYNTSIGIVEGYDSISAWRPVAGVLHTHHFEDATRNISLSEAATGTILSFTFDKKYANSYLIIKGMAPSAYAWSYQSGEYIEIAGSRKYEACHFVSPFEQDYDGRYGGSYINGIWTDILTTGTKTVTYGWSAANGGSNRPGAQVNPDQQSPRTWARTTIIDIYEVDPASVSNIT